jgi:uncharacterized protein YukE
MGALQVEPGALVTRAGTVESIAAHVAAEAGAVRGLDVGDAPPRTAAALQSALAAWPAALRRLAAALHGTGATLRESAQVYEQTDGSAARAAAGGS